MTSGGSAGVDVPALRPAVPADREAVERMLEESDLPTAGVEQALPGFFVAVAGGRVVGVAGLEVHGDDGVLRSVVVDPAHRDEGLGGRLTDRVVRAAREAGLRRLYLLTLTAADYFSARGFRRIDREAAPPAVQRSVEFREACPASAVAMTLDLEHER